MIKLLIFSLLTLVSVSQVNAQSTHADSVTKAAQKDAKKFQLKNSQIKQVKKGMITDRSDIFKPTPESTKNTNLLADSVYVKAYRATTYQRTMKNRSSAHHLLLGVEITAGLLLAVSMIALAAASK